MLTDAEGKNAINSDRSNSARDGKRRLSEVVVNALRSLYLMSTSSDVSFAQFRYSPADLHAGQPSRRDHTGIDRALRNEFLASCRQNR